MFVFVLEGEEVGESWTLSSLDYDEAKKKKKPLLFRIISACVLYLNLALLWTLEMK